MKDSNSIRPANSDERYLWTFDQQQIDNKNRRAFARLVYLDRLDRIRSAVRRYVPRGRVADIGCAQGNLAAWLAEAGYEVDAFDLNESFLNYAKQKHEYGTVHWHQANAFAVDTPGEFDAVILGELVEHVAHPNELLAKAVGLAKPGGLVIVTTPNGRNIRDRLPSYSEVIERGDLARIEREQFGPGGEHHLFAYTIDELRSHIPRNAQVVSISYVGNSLMNSHVQWVLNRPTAGKIYIQIAILLSRLPGLRERLGLSLMLVLRRLSEDE